MRTRVQQLEAMLTPAEREALALEWLGLSHRPLPIAGGSASADWVQRFRKSAIGGSSVTLLPSTVGGDGGGSHPTHYNATQIVVTTPSTPPAALWGTSTTDGFEYIFGVSRVS